MFELSAGAPALDFVNTVVSRRGTPNDLFSDYAGLLNWAEQAGLVSPEQRATLAKKAKAAPSAASRILCRATELREILFRVISGIVADQPIDPPTLSGLNRWYQEAAARRHLVQDGTSLKLNFGENMDCMLWRVVDSAVSILASPDLGSRLRICAGRTCAWTFLDFSRKRNRRWCDMSVCGNRAKVQRHYQRSHTRGQPNDLSQVSAAAISSSRI